MARFLIDHRRGGEDAGDALHIKRVERGLCAARDRADRSYACIGGIGRYRQRPLGHDAAGDARKRDAAVGQEKSGSLTHC